MDSFDVQAAWTASFGTGSRAELREALARALRADAGVDVDEARARIERAHVSKYGPRSLRAELEDERARDGAVTDDDALVAYQAKWTARLAKLQRLHPNGWRLPGLSDQELRDELTLRLIDAVRTMPDARAAHHRAGKEWGLLFLAHQRNVLRGGFRLKVVLADPTAHHGRERSFTEEERLIEAQSTSILALACERAERGLSRPQRRWLSAMKTAASAGAFFESSGRLNLSAASRLLGKNRSSAIRAFQELQSRFAGEREKLERGSGRGVVD
jgi:hypothetical protein